MKVLIVDDHPLIRGCVRGHCLVRRKWKVVAECGSVGAAVAALAARSPDLIVLDVGLPDDDGFTVAAAARARRPSPAILILASRLNEFTLTQCERHRVEGVLDKAVLTEAEVGAALRALQAGRTYFAASYREAHRRWKDDPAAVAKRLSSSEVRILELIARGLDDREIAARVGVRPATVRTHRDNIRRKLNVHSTPKLMVLAARRGFGRPY